MNTMQHVETIMAQIDALENLHGMKGALLLLCHITAGYMHMHCDPHDFEGAAEEAGEIILRAMIENEELTTVAKSLQ